MRHVHRTSLAAVVLFATGIAQHASCASGEAALVVARYGFCITSSEGRCLEVAVPHSVVAYERLPQDEHGGRYIGFYSLQTVRAPTVVVHVLYAEDQDPGVTYVLPVPAVANPVALRARLAALLRQNPGTGAIVVTALVAAPTNGSGESHVFSRIAVPGPGFFSGRVVGVDGKPVPGAEQVTFSVIRSPPAD